MHDYDTGLDLESFRVTADFPLDGVPAGQNLAPRFKAEDAGRLGAAAGHPAHGAAKRQG